MLHIKLQTSKQSGSEEDEFEKKISMVWTKFQASKPNGYAEEDFCIFFLFISMICT